MPRQRKPTPDPPAITPDAHNVRLHDNRNRLAIRQSLEQLGAGRSILTDRDNVVIAGNGVWQQARDLGIAVREIETDGTELVVIRRTDLAPDDPRRQALAVADNRTQDLSTFDDEALAKLVGDLDASLPPSPPDKASLALAEAWSSNGRRVSYSASNGIHPRGSPPHTETTHTTPQL